MAPGIMIKVAETLGLCPYLEVRGEPREEERRTFGAERAVCETERERQRE